MELDDIHKEMEKIGVTIKSVMSATASTEAVLTGLMAHKDEMPPELFDQMNKSMSEIRAGKQEMESKLEAINKRIDKNGNNNSK